LAPNGSFSTGDLTSWRRSSTSISVVPHDDSSVVSGAPAQYVCRSLVQTGTRYCYTPDYQEIYLDVLPGEKYLIGAWVARKGANAHAYFGIRTLNQTGSAAHVNISPTISSSVPDQTWRYEERVATIPANVYKAVFYFRVNSNASPVG